LPVKFREAIFKNRKIGKVIVYLSSAIRKIWSEIKDELEIPEAHFFKYMAVKL